jgi:FecR protein
MNGHESGTDNGVDEATVRLLRLAGPRPAVPATRASRVRAAVHAEWQIVTRRRALRRRVLFISAVLTAAAALVLVIGRINLLDRRPVPLGVRVAVVEQIDGTPRRISGTTDRQTTAGLLKGDVVRIGDWIETDARARVAVRFSTGTSVRLDIDSRARPLSSTAIELSAGAVYVDTARESGRFEVRTAMVTARDVGTQFEIRLLDRVVRLRVRDGIVELRDRTRTVSGRAGTEILFSARDAVSRPIVAYGSEWDWVARVATPLDAEGMSLADFLERVAHEHGWAVHYADAALAHEASGIILHGSIKDLPPQEMVEVAIATSGLRHHLDAGKLIVLRGAGPRETRSVDKH